MSAEWEVQKALLVALRADSALTALLADHRYAGSPTVSAVYDLVEQADAPESDADFPYVVIGDFTAAEYDTDDVSGQEHTVTLHIWSRYRGQKEVKQIMGAIHDALHKATLTVENNHTVFCYFEFSESLPDPDPRTQHGVVRFRIATQES